MSSCQDGLFPERDEAPSGSQHEWDRTKAGTPFCRRCGRVRQANGSTDRKPCRIVKVTLRGTGS